MTNLRIAVTELVGKSLDWAVAKCEGEEYSDTGKTNSIGMEFPATNYSTDWSLGGPIIDRENINLLRMRDSHLPDLWVETASKDRGRHWHIGDTKLIAAMRCYVASRLGNLVEIPGEFT